MIFKTLSLWVLCVLLGSVILFFIAAGVIAVSDEHHARRIQPVEPAPRYLPASYIPIPGTIEL
jgi:hypothetical protein